MPTAPDQPPPHVKSPPSPRAPAAGGAPRRIFITVAEVSGDKHAAHLIRSLRELDPDVEIEGHGGPEMAAAGAVIHRDTVTRAAMGWRGALRAAEVYSLLRWTRARFQQRPPGLWIGVDSPSMNFHFARAAKQAGAPTLQYVAPQLWAWAPWRMEKLRRWVDRVACILPFEEAYFRQHGVQATFVGHPLFDELPIDRLPAAGPRFPARPPVIGLMPGSRRSEAQANFPRMLDAARRIIGAFPDAAFLIPTTAATHPIVERCLLSARSAGADAGAAARAAHFERDAFDRMAPRCDLCLTVSGTATLHLAGFGVPMIVVYHGSPLLWNLVGRWLIRTRTYALVNLLAAPSPDQADPATHVAPEFVPWYGSTEPAARLAIDLLSHPDKLRDQRRRLNELIRSLDRPGASRSAAEMALDVLDRAASRTAGKAGN